MRGPRFQWHVRELAGLAMAAALLLPPALAAQETEAPELRGQVRLGEEPLAGALVLLHKVSADSAGEIDSVRAARDGSFRFRLPYVPSHTTRAEIFFASVEFRGLHYFGPAITEAAQLDSTYVIQAYDTLSVPEGGAELPVVARSLFLERGPGEWEATDVFQLRNDGDRTLYSPTEGVIWSYPLPSSASDFQIGQADMAPDALRFSGGRMELYAPLPPGERAFLVRYRLPGDDFVLPLPGVTERLEVFVRQPGPGLEVEGMSPGEPVELEEGNVFSHLVSGLLQDEALEARMVQGPRTLPPGWLGILLTAALAAAGVWAYRNRKLPSVDTPVPEHPISREELLYSVARLDKAFGEMENPTAEAERRYRQEREKLIARLRALS